MNTRPVLASSFAALFAVCLALPVWPVGAASLTLGNLVFRDLDNNGVKDAGEGGIGGVTVNLYRDDEQNCGLGGGDTLLTTTTTAADGTFQFADLAPTPGGPEYILEVARSNFLPGGPLEGLVSSDANAYVYDPADNTDKGYPVGSPFGVVIPCLRAESGTMPTSEDGDANTDLTMDFGFRPARSLTLGNLVFRDLDNNGRKDAGEGGIAGVTVNLYRDDEQNCGLGAADTLLASTTTGADGTFEFTGLASTWGGPEYILEVARSNFLPGGALEGLMSSEGAAYLYDPADNLDKGYPVDPPFGVMMSCVRADYGVMLMTEDGDPNTDLTLDFGFTREFRVGNLVWLDLDNDGARDPGEPGLDGVEVGLYRDNGDGVLGDGDGFVQNLGTSGGGRYEFRGVPLGNYFVAIPPWLYEAGSVLYNRSTSTGNDPAPGPNDDQDNDDNGTRVSAPGPWIGFVASGLLTLTNEGEPTSEDGDPNTNLTVDFGFSQGPLPSVGSLVWNDVNNNGVRDPGEPGIGGVGVSLYADDGDGLPNSGPDTGAMWTTTGADGLYQFTGVLPGGYYIRIEYGSFGPGQSLFGMVSSTGVTDPD